MVKPTPCYLARSMADLRAQSGVRHQSNLPLNLKRLRNLYRTAEKDAKQHLEVEGDQERAYLSYYSALEYLNLMRQDEDYENKSEVFRRKYEQRRVDCKQYVLTLRLELEQRYAEYGLVDENDDVSVRESLSDESEENEPERSVSRASIQRSLAAFQREPTSREVTTPVFRTTTLLHMDRTSVHNRYGYQRNVVAEHHYDLNEREGVYSNMYKTFDDCLAATRTFSSTSRNARLQTSRLKSPPTSARMKMPRIVSSSRRTRLRTPTPDSPPTSRLQTPIIRNSQRYNQLRTYRPVYALTSTRPLPFIQSPAPTAQLRTRECGACLTEKSIADFSERFTSTCQHIQRQICTDCVRNNTTVAVDSDNSTDIRCPEQGCEALFDFDVIQRLLVDSKSSQHRYNSVVRRHENRLSMNYVERMPNFVWCAHGCGWGSQLVEDGRKRLRCQHCKGITCSQHRTKWHSGMTCAEYDRQLASNRAEGENQKWLRDHTKRCPGCDAPIEKNNGCDHMTCRRCKHEFCWLCSADYNLIRRHGRDRHARNCDHYVQDELLLLRDE